MIFMRAIEIAVPARIHFVVRVARPIFGAGDVRPEGDEAVVDLARRSGVVDCRQDESHG